MIIEFDLIEVEPAEFYKWNGRPLCKAVLGSYIKNKKGLEILVPIWQSDMLSAEIYIFGTWDRATNCGWPDNNNHQCWASTGCAHLPEQTNSPCCAGAGSLGLGKFHGWLKNGKLVIDGGCDYL